MRVAAVWLDIGFTFVAVDYDVSLLARCDDDTHVGARGRLQQTP
jgi:hypothetical protein